VIRATYDGAKELKKMLVEILGKKYNCDGRKFWSGDTKTFTLPTNARIEVGYLSCEDDLLRYRGRGPSFQLWDECADVPPQLLHSLRAELSAPKGTVTRIVATANPNRPFHSAWQNFACRDPWEPFIEADTGKAWINCPGLLWQNPFINVREAIDNMRKDKNFVAYVTGRWDLIHAGAFFSGAWEEERVIIEPWEFAPVHSPWKYQVYVDHGGGKSPTAAIFAGVAMGNCVGPSGEVFPRNSIVVFDYWDDSTGLETGDWNERKEKPSIAKSCEEIKAIADKWEIYVRGKIDNQVEQDHGDDHTLQDKYREHGVKLEPWSKPSLENAASIVREFMCDAQPDGKRERAGLYITSNCRGLIETIPYLPTHKTNPDAPETKKVPDHGYDCVKALCWDRRKVWETLPFPFRDVA
jgi:hypothetical protein